MNDWLATHKAMTETLKEREEFIQSLVADIVKLEKENKELKDFLAALTGQKWGKGNE
jgi:hypothetical protein